MQKLFIAFLLSVLSGAAFAQQPKYLEEKSAFCYSQEALANYLKHAERLNLDGMNQLVLNGKCGFVPDGKKYTLTKYKSDIIGKMPVIQFTMDDNVFWTFKALLQSADARD